MACTDCRTLDARPLSIGIRKYLLSAVIIAFLPTVALAGAFQDGLAAARSGDHKAAFELWQPLAQQGHAASQLNIGLMYENGHGVAKSYAKAARWYHKSAAQGFARAQAKLGQIYNDGKGVAKDYKTAVKWYLMAAEQGNVIAQGSLGGSYGNGFGVDKDYVQAHMWLSLAAAQGSKSAGKTRDIIAKRMSPEQLAESEQLVLDRPAAASQ